MFRWYRLASAFLILQGMSAFGIVDRLLYGEWLGKPGNKITTSLNLLLIVASLALFLSGMRRIRRFRMTAALSIGIACFLLLSAAWSVDPGATVRGGITYLFIVLGTIGIASNLETDEIMSLLAWLGFLCGVASLLLLVVSHANAMTGEGDFRGIFSQKNVIGEAMTMGALGALHGLRVGGRRVRNLFFLAVVTTLALMSQSATSCLTIFAFCAADMVLGLLRKGGGERTLGMCLIVLMVPLLLVATVFQDAALELIGKDPTLTGRTLIWDYAIQDIYLKPVLGWGYVAFWSVNNPAAVEIGDALHWFAPQAHNGLLEMLLDVGVVGSAMLLTLWVRALALSLRGLKLANRAIAVSCLLSCVGILLVGISETVLLVPLEASTCVFFLTAFLCEKALRTARLQRYAAVRWNLPRGLPQDATG